MSLLAGLCAILFTRSLGRKRGAVVSLVVIVLYTLLVGAQAAVVRAAVMSGMALIAAQFGRRQYGLTNLAFTASVNGRHPTVRVVGCGFSAFGDGNIGTGFVQWLLDCCN